MRPFAVYPASFDGSTLGWWRFGERGGRLDGVVGPTLAKNNTPTPLDEGYKFAGSTQYLEGAFAGQPARAALTLECWGRAWATATGTVGALGEYRRAGFPPLLLLRALKHATPASSYIRGTYWDGTQYDAQWTGAAADAVLAGVTPWHVAVAMANGSPVRLFVNGVLVAASAASVALNAVIGNYTLRIGQRVDGSAPAASILDEVRLSASARYAANFPIVRFQDGRRAVARGPGLEVMAGAIP